MNEENLNSLILEDVQDWFGRVVEIPIQLIKPDLENLRREFNEEDLIDLGKNIQAIGQLDEITVFPILENDSWVGFFDLHDGERRWRAAKLVGITALRAKIVRRPSNDELVFKRISRVLQTRSLAPEKKVLGLEGVFKDLGIIDTPEVWESYREKLGGGPEWPQLVRVLLLGSKARDYLDRGLINFTIAQSIGRLPPDRQAQLAEYVVVNKINGRFFSTQMAPYLIEHPDASPAQAFEHTRVGDWRQYSRSPYQKGHEPSTDERVEDFLNNCVKWERTWEVLVHTGLVRDIHNNSDLEYRVKDAAYRIAERAYALSEQIRKQTQSVKSIDEPTSPGLLNKGQQ